MSDATKHSNGAVTNTACVEKLGEVYDKIAAMREDRKRYNAIIMEVVSKVPGEARWETARRMVRERETRYGRCQGSAAIDEDGES